MILIYTKNGWANGMLRYHPYGCLGLEIKVAAFSYLIMHRREAVGYSAVEQGGSYNSSSKVRVHR